MLQAKQSHTTYTRRHKMNTIFKIHVDMLYFMRTCASVGVCVLSVSDSSRGQKTVQIPGKEPQAVVSYRCTVVRSRCFQHESQVLSTPQCRSTKLQLSSFVLGRTLFSV